LTIAAGSRANAAASFAGIDMAEQQIFAIVPVKPLREGKSRLSSIMTVEERQALNAFLMRRTFDLIADFPGVSRSIVISADRSVTAEAEARGINFMIDEDRDLNGALARATRNAMTKGAEAIIVLPVDLPLATSADLKRVASRGGSSKLCVIVPDRHRSGTNLLYVSPPCDDLYRFGPDSLERHREAAMARGFGTIEIDDPALSLDIDEPADYERWQRSETASSSTGTSPRMLS
jgi:2-phospho-L-lactate guanylyltransferase